MVVEREGGGLEKRVGEGGVSWAVGRREKPAVTSSTRTL